MYAADFVLGTLSHYIKRSEGPPPGIPARASAAFETGFATLCVEQHVAPIVTRSLDMLVLPPSISRVTVARLKSHGEGTAADASRRMRALARVCDAFQRAGVPALVTGDTLAAATLYGRDPVRAVTRLELIVREEHARAALVAAAAEGFSRRGIHPVLGAGAAMTTTAGETVAMDASVAREVVDFHQYMSPLVLRNDDGDLLHLRFRVVRLGAPLRERAWERSRDVDVAGVTARGLGWDDQLVDLLVRIGISGYTDLCAITDAGIILVHHADAVDWEHVAVRARMHGLYAAFHHVLRHVGRALELPGPEAMLGPPAQLHEKWLDLFWQPVSIDYMNGPDNDRRFLYGLAACGGFFSKLDWAFRSWVPRPSWVGRAIGDPSSPMNWLEFVMMIRREPREAHPRGIQPARTTQSGNVKRFQRRRR